MLGVLFDFLGGNFEDGFGDLLFIVLFFVSALISLFRRIKNLR